MTDIFSGTLSIGNGSIKNRHISNVAADIVSTDKVQPLLYIGEDFGFVIGGTPTTKEIVKFVAPGSGTLRGYHAMLNDTGSGTGITFDIKKNGTTMLSSTASITNSDADKAVKDGTLSVTTFTTGDVLSFLMTVTTSTGAQGPFAWAVIALDTCPTA